MKLASPMREAATTAGSGLTGVARLVKKWQLSGSGSVDREIYKGLFCCLVCLRSKAWCKASRLKFGGLWAWLQMLTAWPCPES